VHGGETANDPGPGLSMIGALGLLIGSHAINAFIVSPFSSDTPIANFFIGFVGGTVVGFIISGLMVMVWPKDSLK
jgi:hypothetical protein